MANYKMFTVPCVVCRGLTSKTYARANGGKCKACATGVVPVTREPRAKCGQCGAVITLQHERAFQEYPGASVQGGYDYYSCAKCGHEDTITNWGGYSVRENTRGW